MRLLVCLTLTLLLTACQIESESESDQDPSTTATGTDTGTDVGEYDPRKDPAFPGLLEAFVQNLPSDFVEVSDFNWERPFTRNNGETLHLHEIAGYKIRYRFVPGNAKYQYLDIPSNEINSLIFDLDDNNLEFEGYYEVSVATYDTDDLISLYSDPVILTIKSE